MEFSQIVVILIIAYLVLGPEKMMDLAFKMGQLTRKAKEVLDEIKMQAYIENVNKKVLEEEKTKEELKPALNEELKNGETTNNGAPDRIKSENN